MLPTGSRHGKDKQRSTPAPALDRPRSFRDEQSPLQKVARRGLPAEDVDGELDALTITVSPFGRLDARLAASFYRHHSGLSLADRVCLALARSLSSPAYTADHVWETWATDLGVAVRVIR
jgi:ribonuclease VapC